MDKNRTLIICDCKDWAIYSLVKPLKKLGLDICYHYINTSKGTGIGEKNPVHLTIDLLRKYEQIHFNTIRAVDVMLRNDEVLEAVKGKRLIMTIHTEREEDLKLLKGKHWQRIDQFISPTRYQQKKVKEYTGKNAVYIPYAIDEKKYSFIEDYPRKTNVIGYVGRVTPHKHLKEIMEASSGYSVVGIGYVDDGRSGYWQSIPRDNLTMYQQLTEDQKIEQMRNFTLLVSISEPHIETGPLGVLECAALGIPILITDVGWAKDNLASQSARFLDDTNSLEDNILRFLLRTSLQNILRQNAREVIDNWTLQDYINAHKEIYG